jgi:HlyD family secretion protein
MRNSQDWLSWLRERRGPVSVMVIALCVSLAAYAIFWRAPSVSAYAVARGNIVQTVVASGRVVNPLRVEIGSQITGTVARIPVAEGQTVKAGEILIELEADELRSQVEQARVALAQAEARLRQLRDTTLPSAQQALRQAQANLIDARSQYERTRELHDKGFIGPAQLDDAKRNLDVAESQVRTAQLQVDDNRAQGNAQRMVQMAVDQARAVLLTAQANLDHAVIKAPLAGTLISRDVERGDVAAPSKVLMVLSPTGETQLVVQIDEKNLALLELGQPALASADAYPNQTFPAEVVYVNPGVDPQRGSVEVKLRVPSPPNYLRQDMTVSVDIEVARRTDAIVVPSDAVHDAGGSQPWIMRVEDGRARRQSVKVGIRGDSRIEVTDGLHTGELVLAGGVLAIADGGRVRAQSRAW